MSRKITGTIQRQDLGPGFWGIIGDDGRQYRPDRLPASMQQEGLRIEFVPTPAKEEMSIFMWGETVRLQDAKVI